MSSVTSSWIQCQSSEWSAFLQPGVSDLEDVVSASVQQLALQVRKMHIDDLGHRGLSESGCK